MSRRTIRIVWLGGKNDHFVSGAGKRVAKVSGSGCSSAWVRGIILRDDARSHCSEAASQMFSFCSTGAGRSPDSFIMASSCAILLF